MENSEQTLMQKAAFHSISLKELQAEIVKERAKQRADERKGVRGLECIGEPPEVIMGLKDALERVKKLNK